MDKNLRKRAEIGKRVSFLLKQLGWSQADLADKSGLKRSKISGIVHGNFNLELDTVVKLEEALKEPVIVIPKN